jgi:hypothetical protein
VARCSAAGEAGIGLGAAIEWLALTWPGLLAGVAGAHTRTRTRIAPLIERIVSHPPLPVYASAWARVAQPGRADAGAYATGIAGADLAPSAAVAA